MENYVFSYGTLMLPSLLERFKSSVVDSVFVKGHKLIISDAYLPYHYLQLVESSNENDVVGGLMLKTEHIENIDEYEGDAYERKEILVWSKNLRPYICFAYFKK